MVLFDMKILLFSAPSLRWHLNVKQCKLSSGDFFTIWIKRSNTQTVERNLNMKLKLFCIDLFRISCWSLSYFVLISFMWFLSLQFKTMLMSLWSDEGIQTAFQRCIFYPLFYIWGILLTKQTFTFYWLCLFSRRNEYQLTDSVQYFLNNVERIAAPDYVPTLQVSFFLNLYLYLLEGWRSSRLLVFNPSC